MENVVSSNIDQVKAIIESRTKFLSLSGISGVLAGSYAIIGAVLAYNIIYRSQEVVYYNLQEFDFSPSVVKLILIAVVVFLAALITSYLHSRNKARKEGVVLWSRAAWRMLGAFLIPLFVGAIFIFILFLRQEIDLIAPSSLIFYGLALVNASNFTFKDVKYLGIAELILGLTNMLFTGQGLYFWALGFGVFHIVYGLIMYLKYDRQKS